MAINATEKPLGKVFTPDYQLSIPSFQRAYIWKPENILQLISDLEEACKSPETPYFLGSLILVREGDTSFSVIDASSVWSRCQSSSPRCATSNMTRNGCVCWTL